jgi:hypothetical protein
MSSFWHSQARAWIAALIEPDDLGNGHHAAGDRSVEQFVAELR